MSRHLVWQWQAPTGSPPDSYNLYKGFASGGELLYQSGLPGLTYSDPEATPGSTYFGYVTAVTGGVESGPTNEATVTVPIPDLGGPMSETHLFSTGILYAGYAAPFAASRGLVGAVTTPQTQSLANLSDGNTATTASFENEAAGSNTNYQYLVLDLLAPRLVTGLTLSNVTLPGLAHSVLVTASNTLSLTGVPAGTVLPTTPAGPISAQTVTATAPGSTITPTTPGGGVVARYVYIQDTNTGPLSGSLLTIGEVRVQASVVFGILQDVSFGAAYTRKDLFDAAQIATFAVDTADHEGKWTIKAGNAAISAAGLQTLIAAQLSTVALVSSASGFASLNTLSGKVKFPPISANLILQDTTGHPVTVAATFAKAIGDSLALKVADFAVQNFELHCYPDPANAGTVAVISYNN